MRKRSKAREVALQVLYQADVTDADPRQVVESYFQGQELEGLDPAVRQFAAALVISTAEHLKEIDLKIASSAENWQFDRMAIVDRNILRLASCELLFRSDIPPKVAINEAVDLAKKFGDMESGKFVNGILDKISKTKNQVKDE